MENFKPDLNLIVQKSPGQLHEYYLHSVTPTDKADYRADNSEALIKQLAPDGSFEIELSIKKDEQIPDFGYPTPVVHTYYLGTLPFGNEQGLIKVNIMLKSGTDPKKKVGEATVSTVRASEDSRPIGMV